MLCITRLVGESVRIGEATVVIRLAGGGKVSLGISAPPHVPIVRGELGREAREEIERRCERAAAAKGGEP